MTQAAAAENPLLAGLRVRRAPEPCALAIFGASGDLTQRKLLPALYSLALRRLLPPQFGVLGVARTEMTTDEFRERARQAIVDHARDEFRQDVWDELVAGLRYVSTDFADEGGENAVVTALADLDVKQETGGNRVY
jgi:glucose-6-phosphate 1-dehydrogenase